MMGYLLQLVCIMNTLTLNTTLYKALEEEAAKTGKRVDDLAAEAIESWLSEDHVLERNPQDCTSLFSRLAEEWRHERPRGVDVASMVMHPSYQRIIGMGEDAIPLILSELDRQPDHWFWALHSITGADPVPEECQGNISQMATAWLAWGRQEGFCQ